MASANNNASRFKVVLLGEGRVGKTSLLLRYVKDTFDDRQISTIQVRNLWRSVQHFCAAACLRDVIHTRKRI
jgi:Ras-related protein Rab-21